MKTKYFVVPAPGYYGDRCRVVSSHATAERAISAATSMYVVRVGSKTKGDIFYRADELIYPQYRGAP